MKDFVIRIALSFIRKGLSVKQVEKEFSTGFKNIEANARKTGKSINEAFSVLGVKPLKDIEREIKRLNAAYKRLKDSGKLSFKELYRAEVQLKEKISELKKETNGWVNAINRAKAGIIGLAGAGYTFVKAFSAYGSFTQKMAEVNTLLDLGRDKFQLLSKQILSLSKQIPQTAEELASAEYDIISAGVKMEESINVLRLSALAAIAGVTDTKTAVRAGIGILNAYNMKIDQMSRIYDVLFMTVKKGVTTFPELATYIGEVLPSARAAGVEIEELAASIAELTKAGIRTPQAITALKGMFTALAAPTPEAKKRLQQLNISWKGLIPTLEKIASLGLSLNQMREIVPDVEARTAVLALTQRLKQLKETLLDMKNASGAMQTAYEDMKDTPENKVKLLKNEIHSLSIEIGAFVSKFALPAIDAIRRFKDAISEADTVTKYLVGGLSSASFMFMLWKAGLSQLALGLKGIALEAYSAVLSLNKLSIISKALFLGTVVYGSWEVAKLVKEIWQWHSATTQAHQAQQRLLQSSEKIIEKFKQFRDVKIPADITGNTAEQLDVIAEKLHKAKAYWIAMVNKMEIIGDQKGLFQAKQRLEEIEQALKKIENSQPEQPVKELSSELSVSIEKIAEFEDKAKEAFEEFRQQAKRAYEEAKEKALEYARRAIEIEEKIKLLRMSTQDRIRALLRRTMTEEQAWYDKRLEAEQKLAQAKEAYKRKDYELAERLAKQSEQLFVELATEIRKKEAGKSIIVKTVQETTQVSIEGINRVKNFLEELYTAQKQSFEKLANEYEKKANSIEEKLKQTTKRVKALLDELAKARAAKIILSLERFEQVKRQLDELVKPAVKKITVETITKKKKGGAVVGLHTGGWIKRIGHIPGYGGGDKIKALLEAGEYVVRKEAVKKYGVSLLNSINRLSFEFPAPVKVPFIEKDYKRFEIKIADATIQAFSTEEMINEFEKRLKRRALCQL